VGVQNDNRKGAYRHKALADATTGSKGRVNYYHMAACYQFWGRILDNNIP
jgi:hypothetical protein